MFFYRMSHAIGYIWDRQPDRLIISMDLDNYVNSEREKMPEFCLVYGSTLQQSQAKRFWLNNVYNQSFLLIFYQIFIIIIYIIIILYYYYYYYYYLYYYCIILLLLLLFILLLLWLLSNYFRNRYSFFIQAHC